MNRSKLLNQGSSTFSKAALAITHGLADEYYRQITF
jgi:hypothetical protein